MRAYMPIYLIGLVAAVYALMKLYGFVKGQIVYLVGRIGEKLRYVYPRQAFFYIVGHILLCTLAVGVLVGAFYLAMSVFLRPVSVFVEWVPEVLVSWQSISARFWELVRAQAQPVRYTTGEYAAVAFGAFLIRWGTMLFLIGLGLKSITLKQKGQGR